MPPKAELAGHSRSGLAAGGQVALQEGVLQLAQETRTAGESAAIPWGGWLGPSPWLSAGIAWDGAAPRAEPLRLSHPVCGGASRSRRAA
jgi:hypothetical protein